MKHLEEAQGCCQNHKSNCQPFEPARKPNEPVCLLVQLGGKNSLRLRDSAEQGNLLLKCLSLLILVRVQAETNNPGPCTDAPHPVLVRSQPWQARLQGLHHPGHV